MARARLQVAKRGLVVDGAVSGGFSPRAPAGGYSLIAAKTAKLDMLLCSNVFEPLSRVSLAHVCVSTNRVLACQ